MPLPSAVQKIGDAAEAAATEAGMKPGSKPLQQVEPVKTVSAVINEPAKTDPSDYQTRYSNYKKATDQTITELRSTLADIQATLADTQRQNQDLLAKLNAAPAAEIAKKESVAGTKEDPAYKTWFNNLSQHIKDEYTEDYLFDQFTIQKSLAPKPKKSNELAALETKIDGIAQFQEKTKAELYEDEMDRAFPNDEWINLANGPEWSKFCAKTISAVDSRTYGDIVEQGSDSHTSASVIWVLQQYKQYQQSTLDKSEVSDNPLSSQLTPEGAGGGGGDPITEINAQAETFTLSQVQQFFNDVASTRKYSAEDAAAIEKQIMAAQNAGKIIPG